MSFYTHPGSLPRRFRLLLSSFLQHSGLPFADVLSAEQIHEAFDDAQASFAEDEDAIYTPAITLWAFLSQMLHKDEQRSCTAAMTCGMAMGPYSGKETGETALFRGLLGQLSAGDILLADRYYCSYFMIAMLLEAGVDFVVRLHQLRAADFRRGRRLGRGDHVVAWPRPDKPDWMDEETYQRMPASITVREVHVQIAQPGFRVDSFTVVTTLIDAKTYTQDDIAELYHKRWLAELDIRAIKITQGMDVLRCKSPEMVRKEIWTSLLAYNLIRHTMLQAAAESDRSPRQLSFTAALQKIAACWMVLLHLDEKHCAALITIHLSGLRTHRVGHRPDRIEPRAIKRRPKPHKLLTKPRHQARAELLAGNTT